MGDPAMIGDANPWWVVLAAAVPSGVSGAWVMWRWWAERGDQRATVQIGRDQSLMREIETQRAALSREHADLVDRIRAELVRCQLRLTEVEHDRDRGWDLARWWNRRAHELRHAGVNAQTAVQNMAHAAHQPEPGWPDMTLPGLEDP